MDTYDVFLSVGEPALDALEHDPNAENIGIYVVVVSAALSGTLGNPVDYVKRTVTQLNFASRNPYPDLHTNPDLINILESTVFNTFDPRAWMRSSEGSEE